MPILFFSLIPTLLIWLPFYLRLKTVWTIPISQNGMATIVANYDGPLFLVVAKTFYDPAAITQNFSFPLPVSYYPAHFPLFPAMIKLFSLITGFPYAMLTVTLLSSFLALYFFNKFIRDYTEKNNSLWLTFLFAIFPARWLIVRSVGSAEPMFLASTIASIYYFKKEKYLKAGIWGIMAQLTKSAGIILFVSYLAAIIFPKLSKAATQPFGKWIKSLELKKIFPILLIPLSLLGLFIFYKTNVGDFLAYFHSGDNIHLFFPPFQIFNYSQPWVGTFWLEEVIFVYLFGILGVLTLAKNKDVIFWFTAIFFISTIFVSHRDIIRYSLPIVPFLIAAFSEALIKKEFKIAIGLLIIPIYLFSLAYISQNVMPISDWSPFL